jgi:hypothetical protein
MPASDLRRQLCRAAYILICLFALALLAGVLARYKVDAPKAEQWYFLFTVEKAVNGTAGFRDLWAQEAEHRHLFPHLVMIGMAVLTRWSFTAELVLNVMLAGLGGLAIIWHVRRLHGDRVWLHALTPAIAVLVWSLTQVECWLWSYEMVTFMSVAATAWSLALLAGPAPRAWHFGAALALAVISSYSFANGFMTWPAGALVLWLAGERSRRVRLLAIWSAAAIITTAIFVIGYRLPAWSAPATVAKSPLAIVRFILMFVGSPVGFTSAALDLIAGVTGIVGFAAAVWWLARRIDTRQWTILPLGLAAFVLLSAGAIALGRAHMGDPTHTRYITFATLMWIGLLVMLLGIARHAVRPARLLGYGAIVAITLFVAVQSVRALPSYRWYHGYFGAGQRDLVTLKQDDPVQEPLPEHLTPENTPLLRLLPWDPPVRLMVETLRSNRLNVFASEAEPVPRD